MLISSLVLAAATITLDPKIQSTLTTLVPEARVVEQDGDEYELETPRNTRVEIKLDRAGVLDEASGDAAENGDVLVPGDGRMTLTDAVAALKKAGKAPTGDWSLEKSLLKGWVYEFEGRENGKEIDYKVSATDGKLL